jgi:hypothetical protein
LSSLGQTVVASLDNPSLLASRARTVICNIDNDTIGYYSYIAYPASFGNLTGIIQNGALPVLSAFTLLGDFNYTNAYGVIVSMRVYVSNSDAAFASGTSLAIS